MSPIRLVRERLRRHPDVLDVTMAAAFTIATWWSAHVLDALIRLAGPGVNPPSEPGAAFAALAQCLPFVARRRWPLWSLTGCVVGFLLARIAVNSQEVTVTALLLSASMYSAAAHGAGTRRHLVVGSAAAAVLARVVFEVWREPMGSAPYQASMRVLEISTNVALLGGMWALGTAVGNGRRRAAALQQRTVELEREREAAAARAVFHERVRIARELHDVVAHHVSVMGLQAGAARLTLGTDPQRAAASLEAIEDSSRRAVQEMHRLLGFLRQDDEPAERRAAPGVDALDELARSFAGRVEVRLHVDGPARPLPDTLSLSVFRIVQEALTNVVKHANARLVDITLRYAPRTMEVTVRDDGRGAQGGGPGGAGLGLVGIRERVSLHGGEVTAGPCPDRGFAVHVTLPIPEPA